LFFAAHGKSGKKEQKKQTAYSYTPLFPPVENKRATVNLFPLPPFSDSPFSWWDEKGERRG